MGSVSHSSSSSTPDSRFEKVAKMDSIRKKMQSMKADTDEMYAKIQDYENVIKETNNDSDKFDNDIRDTGKRVQKLETGLEEIMEKLQASNSKMEEAEAEFKDKEDDVNAQSRRVLLLEEECRISVEKLATTVYKLALMSKDADNIIKNCRQWENNTSNNEMEIELGAIGENQKQLEVSEEKARRREEKYQEQIKQINIRLKQAESRSEYAEMNISKLHLRIDELEDDIIREKMKINVVCGQLDETFNEMINKY